MITSPVPPTRPTASGLTPVELSLLRAIEDLGGVSDGRYVRTLEVLERLDAEAGVGRRYSEKILADLVVDWVRHLPLVDGQGNFGSIAGDPGAEARYTEVRLSAVGQLALASERGEVGPLPLDLIEGSLYRGGPVPPLDPATTIRAVLIGAGSAGLPRTPTGTITADAAGIERRQGRWFLRYQLGSAIRTGRDRSELVITSPPFLVPTETIIANLRERIDQERIREEHGDLSLPGQPPSVAADPPVLIRDVRDETSGRTGTRIVVLLKKGVDVIDGVDWVRSVWPVTVHVDCVGPEQVYDRFATWFDLDKSGVHALDELLNTIEPDDDDRPGWLA
ncbi:DNA gyrase subunit A [Terrabacter sp. NPDC080008]|uniref:DNA gyrase subunit A n=1 Tax=Terrabacter sp. NPDC080008 TaxID=3155176 RepID=UPI00344D2962